MENDNNLLRLDKEYINFVNSIKDHLRLAKIKASLAVNSELISFYWYIGKEILDIQSNKKHWGSKFLDQLSQDLQSSHPGMTGFSRRNLEYMRLFTSVYPDKEQFTQQPAAQLPWSHIQLLLDKFKIELNTLEWYALQCISYGWSRSTLSMHIKSNLYQRQALETSKVSNYRTMLPAPQSDLAHEMLKNPYNLDFLTISETAHEREIEKSLIKHIKNFLLELGAGFAFVGTQVPLSIDGEQYFVDILFYHLKLRCYVVVELKAKKFRPSDVGQLSFYLSAIDDKLRHQDDNPSIGILLCESRSKIVAEYALKNINAPIGVSEYSLSKALPKDLKSSLPTIEEIELELNDDLDKEV